MLTLDEVKQYLRVDSSEEDTLIEGLIKTADSLVRDVGRMSQPDISDASKPVMMAAELYTVAYLYEHREEADHHGLILTLRALLLQGFFLLLCDSIRFRKRDHGSGCYHTEGDNRLYRPLVQGA